MLALDHRDSLKKLIDPQNPDSVSQNQATDLKEEIIATVFDQCSGVLLDIETGLPAYKRIPGNEHRHYLLAIENSGYKLSGSDDARLTAVALSSLELKAMGAQGIKLLIYFNSSKSTAQAQINTARHVLQDAHACNLPLFLEVVTYGDASASVNLVLESVEKFLEQDVRPDVFKLEYPGSKEACEKVTNILGTTPWIILTRGNAFGIFESQLEEAMAAGAQGFLAGRALWQEACQMTDESQRKEFLEGILVERFKKIREVALKSP